jgi:hypothetical protein
MQHFLQFLCVFCIIFMQLIWDITYMCVYLKLDLLCVGSIRFSTLQKRSLAATILTICHNYLSCSTFNMIVYVLLYYAFVITDISPVILSDDILWMWLFLHIYDTPIRWPSMATIRIANGTSIRWTNWTSIRLANYTTS